MVMMTLPVAEMQQTRSPDPHGNSAVYGCW